LIRPTVKVLLPEAAEVADGAEVAADPTPDVADDPVVVLDVDLLELLHAVSTPKQRVRLPPIACHFRNFILFPPYQ
jgi:hypothetical protein